MARTQHPFLSGGGEPTVEVHGGGEGGAKTTAKKSGGIVVLLK
jgi:hypothetical protein